MFLKIWDDKGIPHPSMIKKSVDVFLSKSTLSSSSTSSKNTTLCHGSFKIIILIIFTIFHFLVIGSSLYLFLAINRFIYFPTVLGFTNHNYHVHGHKLKRNKNNSNLIYFTSQNGLFMNNNNDNFQRESNIMSYDDKTNLLHRSSPLSRDISTMNRRDMMIGSLSASLLLINPNSASAQGNSDALPSLEHLKLGEGRWVPIKQQQQQQMQSSSNDLRKIYQGSNVPPTFATYAARLLINYDMDVSQWWDETIDKFSLLPREVEREKLGRKFGLFAKSIQVSMEYFIDSSSSSTSTIAAKMEELSTIFLEQYGINDDGSCDTDIVRQIGILFSLLPPDYQPITSLQRIQKLIASIKYDEMKPISENDFDNQSAESSDQLPIAFTDDLTRLLPSKYSITYNSYTKSFQLTPSISFYEVGIGDEFGQNAIATLFGPLASTSLTRKQPRFSWNIYSLFSLSGGISCALTHLTVVPVDTVKTRLQTSPGKYKNIIDGVIQINKNEGFRGLLLGTEATLVGYSWYGFTVYPCYTFFKRLIEYTLLSPAVAAVYTDNIALVAGALASIVAGVGLTPLEACRIRVVAEPEIYRDLGLIGVMKTISQEDVVMGWKTLFAGLPSLLTRQVIFGSVKFLAFERACDAIFTLQPGWRDTVPTTLLVTLLAGAFSGALSSIVSQPADSVLTYVARNSKNDNNEKNGKSIGVFESVQIMIQKEGIGSLYRGVGTRCLWASCIISGQFFLYDLFRTFLNVNSDDLSQVFQIVIGTS